MNNGNQPTQQFQPPQSDPLAPFSTPINQPLPQAYALQPQQPAVKKSNISTNLIKLIALIVTSLTTVVFIILFVWMYMQWKEVNTDVEGRIDKAVAEAEHTLRTELETEFAEKEKYPFKTFAGPSDFGNLNFEYPKTWSVYIPEDAAFAGDFHAYLHPDHVSVVDDETVMALRVSILNTLTESVLSDFNEKVEDGEMTHRTTVANGVNVDIYTGLLDSDYYGIVCIFKIRDKTVILQTDAMTFENDFNNIIDSIRYKA